MKKLALSLCGLALALLAPTSMFADTLFNFSFNTVIVHGQPGLPYGASGQFDTFATNTPGVYTIVGATGTVSSLPIGTNIITGISNTNGTLTSGNGSISLNGVGLLFDHGTISLDAGNAPEIFLNTGYLSYLNYSIYSTLYGSVIYGSEIASVNVTITEVPPPIAATPEPGTFILLGTGLAGIAGVVRRRIFA